MSLNDEINTIMGNAPRGELVVLSEERLEAMRARLNAEHGEERDKFLSQQFKAAEHGNRRFVEIEVLPRAPEELDFASVKPVALASTERRWTLAQRCPCRVDGCDPTGVRECEKGIRERKVQP